MEQSTASSSEASDAQAKGREHIRALLKMAVPQMLQSLNQKAMQLQADGVQPNALRHVFIPVAFPVYAALTGFVLEQLGPEIDADRQRAAAAAAAAEEAKPANEAIADIEKDVTK